MLYTKNMCTIHIIFDRTHCIKITRIHTNMHLTNYTHIEIHILQYQQSVYRNMHKIHTYINISLHSCIIHTWTLYSQAYHTCEGVHTVWMDMPQPDLLLREKMSFKTRFKRDEGVRMSEVVRESVPRRWGLKRKISLYISLRSGTRYPEKSSIRRRAELARWSIDVDEFGKRLWSRATDGRKSQSG